MDNKTPSKLLLDAKAVADLLSCSTRHVQRMADYGRMPRPLKLGRLSRWRADEIELKA